MCVEGGVDDQSPNPENGAGGGGGAGSSDGADAGDRGRTARGVVTQFPDPARSSHDLDRDKGRDAEEGGGEGRVDDQQRLLVERFRRGDPDALGRIFDQYAGAVYSVVLSALGEPSLADDAVQETFVRAWRAADRFDATKPMSPWLFTIARRTAIDVHRRETRPTRGGHVAEQDVAVNLPGIEVSWQKWEIQRALAALEPDERELVKLSHFHGFTHSQIASRFGVPVGTIKSRSHRAHRRLAARLRHLDSAGE